MDEVPASPTPSTGGRARARSSMRFSKSTVSPRAMRCTGSLPSGSSETPQRRGPRRRGARHLAVATAELWRFLFGIDLVERVKGDTDPAWPLFLMATDPRRLHLYDRRRALAAPRRPRRRAPRAPLRGLTSRRSRGHGRSVPAERGSLVDRSRARPIGRGPGRFARRSRPRLGVPRCVHVRASCRCRPGSRAEAGWSRARDRALRDAATPVLPGGVLTRL